MKRLKCVIMLIIAIIIGIIYTQETFAFSRKKIPSLEVKVVEVETGKPLEGIVVNYMLRIAYQDTILRIPLILSCYNFKAFVKEQLITDENGYVFIPEKIISLKLNEKIYCESILINGGAPWTDDSNVTYMEDYISVVVSSEVGSILSKDTIIKDGIDEDYYTHFKVTDEINDKGKIIKRKIIVQLGNKK